MKQPRGYGYFGKVNRIASWSVIWSPFLLFGMFVVGICLISTSYYGDQPTIALRVTMGIGIVSMILGAYLFSVWIKYIL